MKSLTRFLKTLLAVCLIPVFAQYEDPTSLTDAPTRTLEHPSVQCTLEGMQVSRQPLENGAKNISVAFLLTQKPSIYFNYYDAAKKAVVFDFYDTHIGESPLDSIREAPITGSSVQFFRIDLNKDVSGLKPDFRDVVRVSLHTPHTLKYDVQEDEGLVTLSFKTGGNPKEAQLKPESRAYLWQLPLAAVIAGAVGFGAYQFLSK